jgi:sugar phosphate isomerase/epimerase
MDRISLDRRSFLKSIPALAATSALAAADTPIKLGFDTYSVRAFKWKAQQLVDFAGGLKLDTIQISSLDDYESKDPAYLAKIKDQAARYNMVIDGGMGCICPTSHSFSKNGPPARDRVIDGLKVAHAVGASAMRCFLGSSADRLGPAPIESHIEETAKVLKSVRQEALDLNVKIAIENHDGDMQAWETRMLIEEAGKDFVGSNLDTGNPLWVVEDPFVTLETLAPYVVTTHIRDSAVFEVARGAAGQWVVLGDGNVDFVRFTQRFRELCPHASMQLEVITGRAPRVIPYLESDFWKAFPKAKGDEFARFVALAKSGRPYMGLMVVEDVQNAPASSRLPVMNDALKEQQRLDLERSLEYAKKKLNVGVNWRT